MRENHYTRKYHDKVQWMKKVAMEQQSHIIETVMLILSCPVWAKRGLRSSGDYETTIVMHIGLELKWGTVLDHSSTSQNKSN